MELKDNSIDLWSKEMQFYIQIYFTLSGIISLVSQI